jgi:hypothetical protein
MGTHEREPSARELRAIQREWPLIEAGLAEVDAEIAAVSPGVVELESRRADVSDLDAERAA